LELINKVKAQLKLRFKMTDLGEAKYYLGMSIKRNREKGELWLGQEKYCLDMAVKFGESDSKSPSTPLPHNFILHYLHELPQAAGGGLGQPDPYSKEPFDPILPTPQVKLYQQIVGSLNYAAHTTRIDIAYAVGQLARVCHRPRQRHLEAARHCVRYLKGTASQCLHFSRDKGTYLKAYADSDHQACHSSKSITGYLLSLAGGPIYWQSKKQDRVTDSSCESEAQAFITCVKTVEFVRDQLQEFGLTQSWPTPVYNDNEATIALASDPISHQRTKQMRKAMNYVRERKEYNVIAPNKIGTKSQPADFLTKNLALSPFLSCVALAGME
jgi:hypothetical protein